MGIIISSIQYAAVRLSQESGVVMNTELVVFIVYLCFMLGIGVYFFVKGRGSGEKEYFLGGRKMGPWVSALSAGASDMSAWVLMGLPASIYAAGIGKAWIAIGLAIGYALSWIFQAPRLRRFSIAANDSITLPQYLTNRFKSSSKILQILCAVIFLIAYTIYAASSVKACGTLFNTVIGIDATLAMYIAAAIIIGYTFMGGFSAVCWTDFFQGLLMLGALLIAPIFALGLISGGQGQSISVSLLVMMDTRRGTKSPKKPEVSAPKMNVVMPHSPISGNMYFTVGPRGLAFFMASSAMTIMMIP